MKIVIVGAGRGLGHVLAQMLAEKGHTVVAGLRRLDDTISEREPDGKPSGKGRHGRKRPNHCPSNVWQPSC